MKRILSAIGGFFVRIGRWIKETAWIQPLLIVGVIFGVIFSIPSIVGVIEKANDERNSPYTFYKKHSISLKGGKDSRAQKLFDEVYDNEQGSSTTLKGQKFFITFVQKTCSACEDAQPAFAKLLGQTIGGAKFDFKTVLVDQDTGVDYSKVTGITSAFDEFLQNENNVVKFEGYAGVATDSYYKNVSNAITDEQINAIEAATIDTFLTPTILLVDFTDDAKKPSEGVTSVFVGVEGENQSDRENTLKDAWNYTGKFGV